MDDVVQSRQRCHKGVTRSGMAAEGVKLGRKQYHQHDETLKPVD